MTCLRLDLVVIEVARDWVVSVLFTCLRGDLVVIGVARVVGQGIVDLSELDLVVI